MRKVLFIFADLNDVDVGWLAEVGSTKSFARGAVLIEQGKPLSEVFILLQGRLSVRIGAPAGQSVAELQQGEIVGELSFLDARPPNATVIASTDALTLAIPRDRLRAKLARDAGFAARFYRALGVFLANRLRQTVSQMGFGGNQPSSADQAAADELDPELLDSMALAARRFELLLERCRIG